jgi:hypothetical protein
MTDLLLRFEERTVGDERLALAHYHEGSAARRKKRLGRDEVATPRELLVVGKRARVERSLLERDGAYFCGSCVS